MNVDFNDLGLKLALRLTEKNLVPNNQKSLGRIIRKHCTLTNGLFLKEYYNNVKTFEQSIEFRQKLLEVTWDLINPK